MFPGPGGVDGGLGMAVCELEYGEIVLLGELCV